MRCSGVFGFAWTLLLLVSLEARASCPTGLRELHEAATHDIRAQLKTSLEAEAAGPLKACAEAGPSAPNCAAPVAESWARRFFEQQIRARAASFKGSHLRKNKVCFVNFAKSLGLGWSFQLLGYWGDSQARKSDGKAAQDFPFDLLANTALLVWLQQEIACAKTLGLSPTSANPGLSKAVVTGYWKQSWERYRELLLTIPFVLSYSAMATGEDAIRYYVEKISQGRTERPHVFSKDYLSHYLEHAFFIGSLEAVLFARMSYATVPFELRWLPRLKASLGSRGAKIVAEGAEWLVYRIPLGVVDGQILLWWKGKSVEILESFHAPESLTSLSDRP